MTRGEFEQSLKGMTDEHIIKQVRELHSAIYDFECFGVNDLAFFDMYVEELLRRGYTIDYEEGIAISKEEDQ